jgi:hypothetical protein
MAIVSGSRYENSIVDYFKKEENGNTYPIVFYSFDSLTNVSFSLHTFIEGETLQGLSNQYYNRPDLWWAIAEYNPEITDLINIPAGTELRIPNA